MRQVLLMDTSEHCGGPAVHGGSPCELVTGPECFLPVHLPVTQGRCWGGEHPQACIQASWEQVMLRGLGVEACRLQGCASLLARNLERLLLKKFAVGQAHYKPHQQPPFPLGSRAYFNVDACGSGMCTHTQLRTTSHPTPVPDIWMQF